MGAIVGALYAAGYAPDEIDGALRAINWESTLRDAPERRKISFRRKEDDDLALFPFEIGFSRKHGLATQSGLLAGHRVDFIFHSMTLHTLGIDDFDRLTIPFRAVAADLETGEAVVLDRGDLATAMRASMSIPAIFTPVEIDGRLVVDGGIANNLPVDVGRSLGAERIIAVNVSTPPTATSRDWNALSVYSQTFDVLASKNVRVQLRSLGAQDLLITPDLGAVRTADFVETGLAVLAGERAARTAAAELRRFAVSEEEFADYLARQRRAAEAVQAPIVVDEVVFRGTGQADPRLLRRRMETRSGAPLDIDVLAKDLDRISQAGEFESVGFRLVPDSGRNRLFVDAREKSWGPTFLRFGVGLESTFEGESEFRFIGNARRARVNRLGGEWNTILTLGAPTSLFTELFQPLERSGRWFVAPHLRMSTTVQREFLPGGEVEELRKREHEAGLDFGVQFGNYGEIRLGAVRGMLDLDPETTTSLQPFERDLGGIRLSGRLDQIDSVFFPTTGGRASVDLYLSRTGLGADEKYDKLLLDAVQAGSIGRNALVGLLKVGTDLGTEIPAYDEVRLGGFLNLSGLKPGELAGDVVGFAALVDHWHLRRLGMFGDIYLGAALEAGGVWQSTSEVSFDGVTWAGLVFIGVDNPLSPIYLGYGIAEGGRDAYYLFIGSPFRRR
jgi:NTE family protein